MSVEGVKKSHVEGLLALYKIWRVERLDIATVITTFQLPEEVVIGAFEASVCEGYLAQKEGECYDLTGRGEEKIENMMVRGGGLQTIIPS